MGDRHNQMIAVGLPCVFALVLTGCASHRFAWPAPSPGRPSAIPAYRTTQPAAELAAAQSRHSEIILVRLGSPIEAADGEEILPPAAPQQQRLTVDQAIHECLLADPRIRAGLEAINQANADALTASLVPNPWLAASQTLNPLTRPFIVTEQGGPPQLDVGVSYSIDWFLFGKRAAAMISAAQDVATSEAEYADLIRQRVADTASAYYDLVEASELLELARQDANNLRELETSTKAGVDSCGWPQMELQRICLNSLQSTQNLQAAEAQFHIAQAKLRSQIGCTDVDVVFNVASQLAAPPGRAPMTAAEAFALAIQSRPDINALRSKIAKAEAEIRVQERNGCPEVAPKLGYTRQFQEKAIGFPDANAWGVGVDISLPLCNRNQGNRLKAQSVAVERNLQLQTALIQLRAEIEQTVQELNNAYKGATAVPEEQLLLAASLRESVQKAYETGARPVVDVLDVRRTCLETRRLHITNRAAYWRAFYKFNAAIGRQVLSPDRLDCAQPAPNSP